jgi:hypothetical protein
MHIAGLTLVAFGLAIVALGLVALTTTVRAQLPWPTFNLTKTVDYRPAVGEGVSVGEVFTITLTFENEWDQAVQVKVRDQNPSPIYLEILSDTITGGAYYDPGTPPAVPDAVEWQGMLDPGSPVTITFQMRAIGGAGQRVVNWAWLDNEETQDTTPDADDEADIYIKPDTPSLAPIDNSDGDDDYTVIWSEVATAVSYTLEEDDNEDFSSPIEVYSGSELLYSVTGKAVGTWHYRVKANNSWVSSIWSNPEWVEVPLGTPELYPIDNADRDRNYLVEWSQVTGASTYTLQEDDDPDFGSPVTLYEGANRQYLVSNQSVGTWYYRVRASAGSMISQWSQTQEAIVGATKVYVPLVVRAWPPITGGPELLPIDNSDGDGSYTVSWTTVPGVESYVLEEARDMAFSNAEELYSGSSTSYDVTGRGASRLYYRVKARTAAGDTDWSNTEYVDIFLEAEPNDVAPDQANGPLMSTFTYYAQFPNPGDINDYFFFDLYSGGDVEVSLRNIPSGRNYDLVLRDSALNPIGYSGELGNADELIELDALPAGRYYIQAYHRDPKFTSQTYHLKVTY